MKDAQKLDAVMVFQENPKDETDVGPQSVGEGGWGAASEEASLPYDTHSGSSEAGIPAALGERSHVKAEVADGRTADNGDDGEEDEDEDEDDTANQGIATRVLSRLTSRSSYDPGPPPDGGRAAWSQCMMNCPFFPSPLLPS